MNKKLGITVAFLIFCTILTGCASKKARKSDVEMLGIHPRTYVIDPFDGAETLSLTFDKYGYNYQGSVNLWKFLKNDKPQAGDTIEIRGKLKSNIDLPNVVFYLADNSSAADYGTVLTKDSFITDLKAGTFYDIKVDLELEADSKGAFSIMFAYDSSNHGQNEVEKVGKPAVFTFVKVEDTTNTIIETGETDNSPKTYNVRLEKYAAFLEIATNYPWVNGKQDTTVISNYQTLIDITSAFGDYLPKAGDIINVTWSATSDIDVYQIYARPVDDSKLANGWLELVEPDWDELEGLTIVRRIKNGVPFTGTVSFKLKKDVVEKINLCLWYDVGDSNPEGPGLFKLSKNK